MFALLPRQRTTRVGCHGAAGRRCQRGERAGLLAETYSQRAGQKALIRLANAWR